jgi:diaminopimelate epimerase
VRYTKGHGTANDFVLLPDVDDTLRLSDAAVQAICDRRTGLGADGILRVVPTAAMASEVGHDDVSDALWFMDYRNADGGAVEMCGNGIRVFARYLIDAGYAYGDHLRIATRDGVKQVWLRPDGMITVDMGAPRDVEQLPAGGVFVSMGNPHIVLFESDLTAAPVTSVGAQLDREWVGGANVEFASVRTQDQISMRVWERGVGETQSCGTGACAVAVAAATRGMASRQVSVALPGGVLDVDWVSEEQVLMTGPAVLLADGELRDQWLADRS